MFARSNGVIRVYVKGQGSGVAAVAPHYVTIDDDGLRDLTVDHPLIDDKTVSDHRTF